MPSEQLTEVKTRLPSKEKGYGMQKESTNLSDAEAFCHRQRWDMETHLCLEVSHSSQLNTAERATEQTVKLLHVNWGG